MSTARIKTPTALAKDIEEKLKEYIKQPNVSVIVSGFVGPLDRQIRVIGEATEPLAIPYRDKMTVLDVMIQTKGLTRYAAGNSSVIVRQVAGKRQTLKVRLSDLLRLSWSHVGDDAIVLTTGKSRHHREAIIPLYGALRDILGRIPKRATTILTNGRRRPWTADGFGSSSIRE